MRLLTDAATGTGTAHQIHGGANRHIEHLHTVFVWGDFDGAAVTLEISPDNTNWFAVPDFSITTDGVINVEFKAHFVRAIIAGGGGGESINCEML